MDHDFNHHTVLASIGATVWQLSSPISLDKEQLERLETAFSKAVPNATLKAVVTQQAQKLVPKLQPQPKLQPEPRARVAGREWARSPNGWCRLAQS